jgi:DVNP family
MKKPTKQPDGKYHVEGKTYPILIGSRAQVYNGTAYKTPGGLKKSGLMMNKWHRIVSVKKHHTAKKEKRLLKAGYTAKKGKFGAIKIESKNKTRKQKK